MSRLTRRQFLKLAGSVMGAAAVLPFADVAQVLAREVEPEWPTAPPASLGRVITWGVQIRASSRLDSRVIRLTSPDEILPLHEQVLGEAVTPHNSIWYKIDDGLVYSAWVQPVESKLNPALWDMAAFKFWGEISVPFCDSRWLPDPKAKRFMRLYYSSVFRIVQATLGKDEQWWYRLQDGITWGLDRMCLRRTSAGLILPNWRRSHPMW